MKGVYLSFFIFLIAGFILHFVWEYSHVGLYGGHEALGDGLPLIAWASAGDILYMLGAVLLVALFKKKLFWVMNARWTDYAALAVLGFFIAAFVEYKALALERWFYLPAMPIIPILKLGFSPVLQMALLLPLTVWITQKIKVPRGKPHSINLY